MISTYRRLGHVQETLEALKRNDLASRTTLYITSDGPMPGHQDEVFAVRRYLEGLEGFGGVELRFFDVNNRQQIWDTRREVSSGHGRYIYLEEDCVTAPGFLSYINTHLDLHADDESVFSVAGYTPPIPEIRRPDLRLFRVPSYNAWGFGTWERCDRLVRSEIGVDEYHELLRSPDMRRKVNESVGVPFYGMLKLIAEGRLFAYDVPARLEILRRGMISLFPTISLVRNIGFDGSGEHCGEADSYHVALFDKTDVDWANLPVETSTAVNRAFARFYGGTPRNRFRFWSKYLRGKMNARPA